MTVDSLAFQYWAAIERARIEEYGFIVTDTAKPRSAPARKIHSPKRRLFKKRRTQKSRR